MGVRDAPESATGSIGRTASSSVPAWPVSAKPRAGAPNVLVFLLDDVGFAQLGCFGSDIRTPTFDRLAAGGLRYRDFHTTAICSPTRACLLTGRNHHSNGVGIIQEMATGYPGYNGMVPTRERFPVGDAAGARLRDVCHRQVASDARRRICLGRVQGALAAVARLRALLRLHRRQDEPVGRRHWSTTTTTSTRPGGRRRAITSTPTSLIARSSTSPTCAPSRRRSRSSCTTASARAMRHTTSSPSGSSAIAAQFDRGWDDWREEVYRAPARDGHRSARHAARRRARNG